MKEYAVFYQFGGWIVKEMTDGVVTGTYPPAPLLQDALETVSSKTGGQAVGIKLIAQG